MKLNITFGAMAPSIRSQLAKQGAKQGAKAATQLSDQWESDASAITRLVVRGLLTDSATTAARRKLLRDIIAGIAGASK